MVLPANIQLTIEPCIVIVIFYNILDINCVLPASPITNVTFQVFQSYDWLYAGGTLFIVILVAMFFACIGVLIAYAHFLTRAQYRTDYDRRLWVAAVSSRPKAVTDVSALSDSSRMYTCLSV